MRFRLAKQRKMKNCRAHKETSSTTTSQIKSLPLSALSWRDTKLTRLQQDEGRRFLCFYIYDALCSNTVKVDGQCFWGVELFMWKSWVGLHNYWNVTVQHSNRRRCECVTKQQRCPGLQISFSRCWKTFLCCQSKWKLWWKIIIHTNH